MHNSAPSSPRSRKGRYVVAMVLGTALSTLGSTGGVAAVSSGPEARAISDMSRYCTACWRNARLHPDAWPDCTQEVFSRLLERVTPDSWDQMLKANGAERQEFLRAIDAVKKRTQRNRKLGSIETETVADRREAHERRLAIDRDAVLQAAAEVLSSRQYQIVQLTSEGWSVAEIGLKLNLSPERVSDEKYKAIRKLRTRLNPD